MLAGAVLVVAPGRVQAADLLFQAEAQTLAGSCSPGQAVRLEGNHDTVVLSGTCGSLLVKGFANMVQLAVAAGGSIRVEGSANRIHYAALGAAPIVETFGPDNDVSPGGNARPVSTAPPPPPRTPSPPPPPAPTPVPAAATPGVAEQGSRLELSGDDQERLADCAGHDLIVTGSRSAYVVRGGCRSVVVRGDLLTVQAVVQPGARIAVTGRGSTVSWAVPGRGRSPAALVRGAGSRVQRAESIGGEPVR